jgi:hypothetical protein
LIIEAGCGHGGQVGLELLRLDEAIGHHRGK